VTATLDRRGQTHLADHQGPATGERGMAAAANAIEDYRRFLIENYKRGGGDYATRE
jgi:hypothetical protein